MTAIKMVQKLERMAFTVVPFGQDFKDMIPFTFEKKLAHGGHQVLRWVMDNIFIWTDPAGNIKPDKAKSTEKIDGVGATITGLDRSIRNEGNNEDSVYDSRGLLLI